MKPQRPPSAATARRTRAVLDEFGLNDTAAGVLWMLDPDNPPAGMRELARRIGCDPSNVTLISDRLEAAGLTAELAEVTMRAENTIELAGEEGARMQRLLDVIEDLDDVQDVFHNASISQ